MTRWARAKGSAASNERVEEEATPWSQLAAGIRPSAESNVEDLEEDFEPEPSKEPPRKEPRQQRIDQEEDEYDDDAGIPDEAEATTKPLVEQADPEEKSEEKKKKRKKRNQDKCLNCKEKGHLKKECPQLSEERRKELQELYIMKIERKGHGTGRKKNKKKAEQQPQPQQRQPSEPPAKKQRTDASEGDKKRNPLTDKTGQVVQEGEGLFQGFRVKKEDVKRLQTLRKKLQSENHPENEIEETLKRERRRAERKLANFRKMVCFNCRQSGHLLVDCPLETSSAEKSSETHCFKCGSKDHTSKNCASKSKGKDAYNFATCFICKQTGHLAKSCPDNPRGLYPKGGGCRFCGSVEHLKADCPRKLQKDGRFEVKINGGNSGGLEDIVDDKPKRVVEKKPLKKVVKF